MDKVEVVPYGNAFRWYCTTTGTCMQTPVEDAIELIQRIKSGELDFILNRTIDVDI